MNARTENPFITPEGHRGFLAKKLFDEMGDIHWGGGARSPTSRKTAAAPKTTIRTATTTSSSS